MAVYILLSAKMRAYFCKDIAIEMGGVSRYFSKVSGSGVGLTLLQRAANGGSDPSWLNLAFLGRPNFPSRGTQILIFKGFGGLWTENRGAQKTPNPTTTDLTPHLRPSDSSEIMDIRVLKKKRTPPPPPRCPSFPCFWNVLGQ